MALIQPQQVYSLASPEQQSGMLTSLPEGSAVMALRPDLAIIYRNAADFTTQEMHEAGVQEVRRSPQIFFD